MTTVVVLRHASAGSRRGWAGDDRLRPLDAKGVRQASALVPLLAGLAIDRVLTSPYVRCVQTVEPVASALGLDVEPRAELAEGTPARVVQRLLAELHEASTSPLVCTHGDVIASLVGWEREARKASVWILGGEQLEPERYLPPPKV